MTKEEKAIEEPDRLKPPKVQDIKKLEPIEPNKHVLSNGLEVFEVHGGTEEVVKFEVMFRAGTKYQEVPGLAAATNSLISDGTSSKTSQQINEAIEHYGVSLDTRVDKDHAWITVFCLNKYLYPVLMVVREIWEDASFPIHEVEHYVDQKKDQLAEDLEKVSFLARQEFNAVIFGEDHPYGKVIRSPEDHDRLSRKDIKRYFHQHYRNQGEAKIFISGKTSSKVITLLDEVFGDLDLGRSDNDRSEIDDPRPASQREHFIPKKDALQAAIRIGRPLFSKGHEDFPGMLVVSTILGGYFGSRLMSNLREDKGYTYGVGSSIVPFQHSGYFFISSEVGSDVSEDALREIYDELEDLRENEVSKEELEHVKRYMSGMFLKGADGPFAMADLFKNVHKFGMELGYYEKLLEKVNGITPQEVRELASKYLQKEDLYQVIAGNPEK